MELINDKTDLEIIDAALGDYLVEQQRLYDAEADAKFKNILSDDIVRIKKLMKTIRSSIRKNNEIGFR